MVACDSGRTLEDVREVLEHLFDHIVFALGEGDDVNIREFGKFRVTSQERTMTPGDWSNRKRVARVLFAPSSVMREVIQIIDVPCPKTRPKRSRKGGKG
ncbi:MAG: HU family DNA-binding protein [Planctomycetota bacterium]|nr:HU family DNA-binding protein [Planctomycetota bacterium]